MRIEEVVGRRIREHREARGLSQEEFGRLLAGLLGRSWPRQAMSAAERGDRSFTAAELMAFSVVMGCDVAELFRLPGDVDSLSLPGSKLNRVDLDRAVRSDAPNVTELRETLAELAQRAEAMEGAGAAVAEAARRAQSELDQVLTRIGPLASD